MQCTKLFLGARGLVEKDFPPSTFICKKKTGLLRKLSDNNHYDHDLLSSDALSPLTGVVL